MIQQINWRKEFDVLRPHVDTQGGIVHVRYRGQDSAPDAFLATLKSIFENFAGGRRTSLRIDPDFFTTHYLSDVLHALAGKIGHALELTKTAPPIIEELTVASGNESDGDLDITANLHIHTADLTDGPALRDRRITTLCKAIREYLAGGRLMIVLNDTSLKEQGPFWRDLWDKGLSALVADGLLLVKMIDEQNKHQGKHPDEPNPEQTISLPVEFDEFRQQHAIDDLARILVSEVRRLKHLEISQDYAIQNVRSFVYSHKRSISRLHTEWSGVLMELVRDAC